MSLTGHGNCRSTVDVFFVISGYLINGLLLRELRQGHLHLGSFYLRRAQRIPPALLVMTVTTLPFAWWLLLPGAFEDYLQSVLGVGTFTANFVFWGDADYFATAAELQPLLHTWSLAVEEQFYLVYPLLLLMLWRMPRRTAIILAAVLCGASFLYASIDTLRGGGTTAFFLLPGRVWEIGVGALCALAPLTDKPARPIGSSLRGGLAAVCLAIVVLSGLAVDARAAHPGPVTLILVLATAGVILFAQPDTAVGRILGHRWMVAIGLASYSIYLWHQPILVFAQHVVMQELSLLMRALLAVAGLLVGAASWRFVEQPFRRGRFVQRFPLRSIVGFGTVALAFMTLGLIGTATEGFEEHYLHSRIAPGRAHWLAYTDYERDAGLRDEPRPNCFISYVDETAADFDGRRCLPSLEAGKRVLVLGDSHARHLFEALSEHFGDASVGLASASGCRPLIPLEVRGPCVGFMRQTFKLLERMPAPLDTIFVSARWHEGDATRVAQTIDFLRRFGRRVYVVGPSPEYVVPLPLPLLLARGVSKAPLAKDPFLVSTPFQVNPELRDATRRTGARYLDVLGVLCRSGGCLRVLPGRIPLHHDASHFTREGARYLLDALIADGQLAAPEPVISVPLTSRTAGARPHTEF